LHSFMSSSLRRDPLPDDEKWANVLLDERARAYADDPSASPWGMHPGMGSHIAAPSDWSPGGTTQHAASTAPPHTRLIGVDSGRRRPTYVGDEVSGWNTGLAVRGAELPSLPGMANWRIEVIVRPYGFLGEYRRSRRTGLWFAGPHRYHPIGS
jgi:hypothetical protein